MDSAALCDTDLRDRESPNTSLRDTHTLLKLFLGTLKRMAQHANNATSMDPNSTDQGLDPTDLVAASDLDLRTRRSDEEQVNQDYLEVWSFLVISSWSCIMIHLSSS